MAAADYKLCDVCGCKTFYDSNLDYDFQAFPATGLARLGDWAAICNNCADTYEVRIVPKTFDRED
jgi:hypothetical protein